MKTFVEPGLKASSKSTTFFKSSKKDAPSQPFFQAKLTIGPVDDQYEREADTVADKVMRMGKEELIQQKISYLGVQHKCTKCEEEEKRQLQKKSSNNSIQRQETSTPDIPSPDLTLPTPSFLQPSSEPDFLAMKQPFFNRNVFQFWDPDSAMQVWRYNFDFFRGFGLSPDLSSSLSNFTTPRFIDSQLKADNPTWWEIIDSELNTSTIMGSIPLFQFNSDFSLAPPSRFSTIFGGTDTSVQRKCAACESEEQNLKRKEKSSNNFNESDQTEHYINSLDSNGKILSTGEREFYESRFGYDFSNVRIHNNSIAAKSAESLNALAYTTGNHIVFNKGQYSPGTESGRRLIAHELTHVVQQGKNVSRKIIQKQDNPSPTPTYGAACTTGSTDPCQYSRCGDRHNSINIDFERAMDYAVDAYVALNADPLSEQTIQALDWYFNSHTAETIEAVRQRLLCISLCLLDAYGHAQYGCLPSHNDALAYVCVGSTPLCTDKVTNICLTNSYFGKSDRVRAEVLIHECGHRIGLSLGGPNFDIYDHRQHFLYLSTSQALMNTDSFALFAGSITNGIRTTIIPSSFPLALGLSGGVGLSGGSPTWYARLNYVNFEFQHPSLNIFNPDLGLSFTLIGESTSQSEPSITASTSFLASLTAGFRISDPRPGSAGGGYFSFWGGPALAVGSDEGSIAAGIGAEAGVAVGYRWRWLDVSAGGIYFHDPTRPEGMQDILTLGPSLSISFLPQVSYSPGSH